MININFDNNSIDGKQNEDNNNDESSTDTFGSNDEKTATSVDNDFVKKETRIIHRFCILYILVLLIFGAVITTLVYFLSQDYENEQIESNYDVSSTMVLNAFEEIVDNKLATITSFTSSITTYGKRTIKFYLY